MYHTEGVSLNQYVCLCEALGQRYQGCYNKLLCCQEHWLQMNWQSGLVGKVVTLIVRHGFKPPRFQFPQLKIMQVVTQNIFLIKSSSIW